ncbi:hypothetical [Yersinia pestis KIM10+]|uniref:Uncharacterized protein n=1 Tax=Yersinia pestis TaxID=632 RepID=Q8CKU2_YERPE|nr:hypothetical [Yersinia pestis KIM10+]
MAKVSDQGDQRGWPNFGQCRKQDNVINQINFGIKHTLKILHVRQMERLTGVTLKKGNTELIQPTP